MSKAVDAPRNFARDVARAFVMLLALAGLVLGAAPAAAVVKTVNGISLDINLPQAQRGANYSFQMAPTGATAPYSFTFLSGALPLGFSLSSDGTVSGVSCVNNNGAYNFSVRITAADGTVADFTGNQSVSLNMTAGPANGCTLTMSSGTLPGATLGQSYSASVSAGGGTAPYGYAVGSGSSLPPGLSLNASTGAITGTPTAAGNYSFTIDSTDAVGRTGSQTYTIAVTAPTIAFTPAAGALAGGTVGTSYSASVTASGGTGPYQYGIASGALPAGLGLNASTGAITGTPTAAGTATFTLRATDSFGATGTASYSIAVQAAPAVTIAFSPSGGSLAGGTVGTSYSSSVTASGGTGPYQYTIASGALPAGLSLNAATGAISGTPTAAGTSSFTIRATDANGATGTASYSIAVQAAPVTIAFSPSGGALAGGTAGASYGSSVTASGGAGPYQYAIASGALPAGLSLNAATGAIGGTPTAAGTASFTIRATDANGATGTASYSIAVQAAPVTIAFSPSGGALAGGTAGASYGSSVTASGGAGPYQYAIASGALPAGISLDASTGAIAGTPTAAGTASFTVRATDSNGASGTASYTIAVQPATQPVTLSPSGGALAGGTVGSGYSASIAASGGTGPYQYAIAGGALPAGLSLDPSTGAVTGTPSASGTASFTVRVTDSNGATATASYTINVQPAPPPPPPPPANVALSPNGGALAGGTAGAPYSVSVSASGGTGPYQYAIASGALPAGLSLDPSTGAIAGTPTASGNASFTVRATDANGATGSASYTIDVAPAPQPLTPGPSSGPLSGGTSGSSYSGQITASGGTAPYQFAVTSGSLPPGLSLDPSTGAITGTPGASGTFTFTVRITDANGATASATYSITIAAPAPSVSLSPSGGGLAGAIEGSRYSASVTASGGTGPYQYALVSGALPAGLSLDSATGAIGGTPTAAGTARFTIKATDSNGASASGAYTIDVAAAPPPSSGGPLPGGTSGSTYNGSVAPPGANGSYQYAIVGGALPPGLSLDPATGAITGTPSSSGSFTFTVRITDGNGQVSTVTYTIDIAAPAAPPALTPVGALPDGSVGSSYSTSVSASGGSGPYRYGLASGALPPGLALDGATGAITGTPTNAGAYSFSVKVTDSNGASATSAYTIEIAAPAAPLAMAPGGGALANGTVGTAYGGAIAASGGTGPYRYAITGGALPAGLTLDPNSGAVTGTPTAPGTSSFTVRITDANGATATADYSVTVAAAPTLALSPSGGALAKGVAGSAYSAAVTASGGTGPYRYTIASGALPTGLTLDPAIGAIAGTPASAGSASFTVQATDANGLTGSADYTLAVDPAPVAPRPDPRLDPDVRGLIQAEAGAARHLAKVQTANFTDRLEQLHRGAPRGDSVKLRVGASPAADDVCAEQMTVEERAKWCGRQAASGGVQASDAGRGEEKDGAVWASGFVDFSQRKDGTVDLHATTAGITLGFDYRFSEDFTAGVGAGFGRDSSTVGAAGTRARGNAYTAAIYGSYHPRVALYFDGLLAASVLDLVSDRDIPGIDSIAHGRRAGRQVFGFVSTGYDFRSESLLLSPYARLEGSVATLDGFAERSGGSGALRYGRQTLRTLTAVLGLRGEYTLLVPWGVLSPRAKVEYRHDFAGSNVQRLGYADLGQDYALAVDPTTGDYVAFSLGALTSVRRWTLGLEYRGTLAKKESSNGIAASVSKKF